MSNNHVPFALDVPAHVVEDLRARLRATRWPDQIPDSAWDYGADRDYVQRLCSYWANEFDWTAFADRCNRFPQLRTTIDGERLHFIHARSAEPGARPLLISHGWPGSVAEFFDIIGLLTDPVSCGGDPGDAFHVVAPSLPGYGFSGPTHEKGWDTERIASAFATLMNELGYQRFFAHGGDWGSVISSYLGANFSDHVAAVHLTTLGPFPDGEIPVGLTDAELAAVAKRKHFVTHETGYQAIQSTKPMTLAYGLSDSPAGLAAWIIEKFKTWSDSCGGGVAPLISIDRLLDNLSIYWLTDTIGSSARLYYESRRPGRDKPRPVVKVPVGHAVFPGDIYQVPRQMVERFLNIVHWTEMPRGGHFAAMEVPDLLVGDIRDFFRVIPL